MAEERTGDAGSDGNGFENPEAAAAAPEETAEGPSFRERVSRRRRGTEAEDQPEAEAPGGNQPLTVELADEPLVCAVCVKAIEEGTEYLQASYGPVHEVDCSHQTKRVV